MIKKSLIYTINKVLRIIAISKINHFFLFSLKKKKVIDLRCNNNQVNSNKFQKIKIIYFNFKTNFYTNCARYTNYKKEIYSYVTFIISKDIKIVIKLNLNEYTQCNYYFGNISNQLLFLIKHLGNKKNIFLDIGTNIGFYSLVASRYFKQIFSFEPQPNCINEIKYHSNYNHMYNIITVENGVSNSIGNFELKLDPLNQGGASLNKPGGHQKLNIEDIIALNKKKQTAIKIDVITLDHYFDNFNLEHNSIIKLIKIDVEGHEESVLEGALNIINKYKPILFIEVDTISRIKSMLSILPTGYVAYDFSTNTLIKKDSVLINFVDIIFYHSTDLESQEIIFNIK